MIRHSITRWSSFAVAAAFMAGIAGCDVDVQDPGKAPTVDVDVQGEPGRAPDVDVAAPDVEVTPQEKTITVPDVEVKSDEKTVTVPDVDVTVPDATPNDGTSDWSSRWIDDRTKAGRGGETQARLSFLFRRDRIAAVVDATPARRGTSLMQPSARHRPALRRTSLPSAR